MLRIGLIKERKTPPDNRVPLTPQQCARIQQEYPVTIVVEPSDGRCFTDDEYRAEGIELTTDLTSCDVLLGVKEVPIDHLIPDKTYFFFSHTKKKQPYNQKLMQALIKKRIRMIDYECLTHLDEQRVLGFGLFAGIVGAHNGLLAYGEKTGLYELPAAYSVKNYDELKTIYGQVRLPNIKIVMTGSGKVAAGILEVMTHFDVESVEPDDFLTHEYDYPVYTHLKGSALYARKDNGLFHRDDFHAHPQAYKCLFSKYIPQTDILMNGIYWDQNIARLFEKPDVQRNDWRVSVIADITCDIDGSVPINVGASTIANPVYGIDRKNLQRVEPYQGDKNVIDVMAVDNLPNELPCDASHYFGAHFEKFVLGELLSGNSDIINRATICENGKLTKYYEYLSDYAY
ncbi:NAD(P)-dependent oxidoreductase [Polluticoccus soli]|uniref:NAD(P)-dependent oxidoreductase n=1 Tax=Polluticoccus soli TaxID=3034150 RepID=UPI0023E0EAB2|nr:NAD(P)-dependent oxidoreductase [Flavipsychrobacter sp. JY13-12]